MAGGPGAQREPEERDAAAERFRRGPREDGFGLGLAIVRDAVRALGGTIEVESALGAGTAIRVRLPGARLIE